MALLLPALSSISTRDEMAPLAVLAGLASAVLPRGGLSLHGEFPDAVAEAVLRRGGPARPRVSGLRRVDAITAEGLPPGRPRPSPASPDAGGVRP